MADNEKQILSLDLDAKGFISSAMEAKKVLGELGEVENISGLLEGFASMGVALGAVGAALYALKKGFDFVMEAEAINRVNAQFELLAQNAGLVPEKLKKGLEESVAGLMDAEDALKVANKAIVELGVNARKIPEIMELARKVSLVFGGDLAGNFETISSAVASGNIRMLRHVGIIIDSESALRNYAKTVGKFVSDLTEQEKKTALLNATLEKGNKSLKGATEDINSLTISWVKFKNGIKEIADFVITKYDSMFGPGFRTMIGYASDAVKKIGTSLTADFGSGIEKTRAQSEKLREELKEQQAEVERLQKLYEKEKKVGFGELVEGNLKRQKQKLVDLQEELQKYDTYLEKHDQAVKESQQAEIGPEGGNEEKLKTKIKFEQDLLKLKEARLMEEMDLETNYDAFQAQRSEQIVLMHEEMEARIKAIDENARREGVEGTEIAEAQKAEIYAKYALDVQKIGQDLVNDQIRVANQSANANARTVDGFTKGWKSASLNASKDLGNFSELGKVAFAALNKNGKSAFIALGDGSKTAAEAMRGFMLNSIADIAEAHGTMLLEAGLGSFNPIQIAEGGALLALSGLLRSVAGGGKGGIGASSGGGGGGGGPSAPDLGTPSTFESLQTTEAQRPQKAVTIQVQGNYFETEQTKRTLMEMIRQETDATAFSYVQINQGGAS